MLSPAAPSKHRIAINIWQELGAPPSPAGLRNGFQRDGIVTTLKDQFYVRKLG
jgi:hypothetical protein